MKYLVVNGDDLGYSVPRNDGIVKCYEQGILTSTSLLINGEAAQHAVDLVKNNGIPTGLHLNLSEGTPLTMALSLLGPDGYMLGKHGVRERHGKGEINLNEVETEMQAQIDKFETMMGIKPTHIDGHQHVHLLPGICEMFCRVLKFNDVSVTRLPIEDLHDKNLPNKDFLESVIQDSYTAKEVFDRFNIRYTDMFFGLNSSEMSVQTVIESLSPILEDRNHTSCEFMVHPGYVTGQKGGCGCGPDDFSHSCDRENEMNMICDSNLKELIIKSRVELTDFQTLFSGVL